MSDPILKNFDNLFHEIGSRDPVKQQNSLIQFQNWLKALSRKLSRTSLQLFLSDLKIRIFDLVRSQNFNNKIRGVLAYDQLIKSEIEENSSNITRLGNYLKNLLSINNKQIIKISTVILGNLASITDSLNSHFVVHQLKCALEWLGSSNANIRKYAALLIFQELSKANPSIVMVYLPKLFLSITPIISCENKTLRRIAVSTLSQSLSMILNRDDLYKNKIYQGLYNYALKGFEENTLLFVTSSIYILSKLFENGGEFIKSKFEESCKLIFGSKYFKDKSLRHIIISGLPKIAKYNKQEFSKKYQKKTLNLIINSIKKDIQYRPLIFESLAELIQSLGFLIQKDLPKIFNIIKKSLCVNKKKIYCNSSLLCIGELSKIFKDQFLDILYEEEIFDLLFEIPLCNGLIDVLITISENTPKLLFDIQNKLFQILLISIYEKPTNEPEMISALFELGLVSANNKNNTIQENSIDKLFLALKTFRIFNFEGFDLLEIVREQLLKYLDHENSNIRYETVLTCLKIIEKQISNNKFHNFMNQNNNSTTTSSSLTSSSSSSSSLYEEYEKYESYSGYGGYFEIIISEILSKLLSVSITDYDSNLRLMVLKNLNPIFDPYLSQNENLKILNIALSDNIYEVKYEAITIIGRLTKRNPGCIIPYLRKQLIQLLLKIEHPGFSHIILESCQLLAHLIESSQLVIFPYSITLMEKLITKLSFNEDNSIEEAMVTTSILKSIGELCKIGGEDMKIYVYRILPILIEIFQDSSFPIRRQTSLKTLGQLIQSTGFVVEPYNLILNLLPTLLNIYKSEKNWSIQRPILNVIGIIGALDPYIYKRNLNLIKTNASGRANKNKRKLSFLNSNISSLRKSYPKKQNSLNNGNNNNNNGNKLSNIKNLKDNNNLQNNDSINLNNNNSNVDNGINNKIGNGNNINNERPFLNNNFLGYKNFPTPLLNNKLLNNCQPILKRQQQRQNQQQQQRELQNRSIQKQNLLYQTNNLLIKFENDPFDFAENIVIGLDDEEQESQNSKDISQILPKFGKSLEDDYYPKIAIISLARVLNNPKKTIYLKETLDALKIIISNLGIGCVPFLPTIVPTFLNIFNSCDLKLQKVMFRQLKDLVKIVKHNIKPYLNDILFLIEQFWDQSLYVEIVSLIEILSKTFEKNFQSKLPSLIYKMIEILQFDNTINKKATIAVLHCFAVIGIHLEAYLHLIIPILIELLNSNSQDLNLQIIQTLTRLSKQMDLSEYLTIIIRSLLICLKVNNEKLREKIISLICLLLVHFNSNFEIFLPIIKKTLTSLKIKNEHFEEFLENYYTNNSQTFIDSEKFLEYEFDFNEIEEDPQNEIDNLENIKKLSISQETLQSNWKINIKNTSLNNTFDINFLHGNDDDHDGAGESDSGSGSGSGSGLNKGDDDKQKIKNDENENDGNNDGGGDGDEKNENKGDDDKQKIKNDGKNNNNDDDDDDDNDNENEKGEGGEEKSNKRMTNNENNDPNNNNNNNINNNNVINSEEKWNVWFQKLCLIFFQESPSPVLRSCSALAHLYNAFAKQLFNVVFLSCWNELDENYKQDLIYNLEIALNSKTIPIKILQTLLNLCEFMEHCDRPLPIPYKELGLIAERGHNYAQALHYLEIEFKQNPSEEILRSLISINNQIQQAKSAMGILTYAQKFFNIELKETWFEELKRWEDALEAYESNEKNYLNHINSNNNINNNENKNKNKNNNNNNNNNKLKGENENQKINHVSFNYQLGKMRCLRALGEWDKLIILCKNIWEIANSKQKIQMAEYAAKAAWNLGNWKLMSKYVSVMLDNNIEGCFLKAVLNIHQEKYNKALQEIEQTRKLLNEQTLNLINESYSRAYLDFVGYQQLIELEEVIEYKKMKGINPKRQKTIKKNWIKRLLGCQQDMTVWQDILSIHSIVIPPKNNIDIWLRFSKIARISGNKKLSEKFIFRLLKNTNNKNAFNQKITFNKINNNFKNININNNLNKFLLDSNNNNNNNNYDDDDDDDDYDNNKNKIEQNIILKYKKEFEQESKINFKTSNPKVIYAYLKHLWKIEKKEKAIYGLKFAIKEMPTNSINSSKENLNEFDNNDSEIDDDEDDDYEDDYDDDDDDDDSDSDDDDSEYSGNNRKGGDEKVNFIIRNKTGRKNNHKLWTSGLQARFHLKLGEWNLAIQSGFNHNIIKAILNSFYTAIRYDNKWYKAWHSWALMNFLTVNNLEKEFGIISKKKKNYLSSAIKGFFRSISLSPPGKSIQDTLRLLTLWFRYGTHIEVTNALTEEFKTISINTWLRVIPQLIARIHTTIIPVRKLLHILLDEIGKIHPQALIYPLTVAVQSQSDRHQRKYIKGCKECNGHGCDECITGNKNKKLKSKVTTSSSSSASSSTSTATTTTTSSQESEAEKILTKMKIRSPVLVEEAELVSQELIRVAILLEEKWHEALDDCLRIYFGEKDSQSMLAILKPLHDDLQNRPKTQNEQIFFQNYGKKLNEAWDCCIKFLKSKNKKHLEQAWSIYYPLFKKMKHEIPQITYLDLDHVSPKLDQANNFELALPGTYVANKEIVRISKFSKRFEIIPSKQRPRKVKIFGNNGLVYQFLLKGHEDIRQDERVMQLFGLVNTLLLNSPLTNKSNQSIQRYPVVPLSPNNGLLGWVPNSDTLHDLILQYRKSRKIRPNLEHKIMIDESKNLEKLTKMQKLELFLHVLKSTDGQEMERILWLKSSNSESWLDRRTNYTTSLAVMSMVGYILGLGDRHPSNLMMNRISGKILHIDFGDCFEVAIHREKFPETIPFRLTRMLIKAMEVSGTEGNFRYTCKNVMKLLRENKDSVMAMLEAFVYDPLINWRLQQDETEFIATKSTSKKRARRKSISRVSKPNKNKRGEVISWNIEETVTTFDELIVTEDINRKALKVIKRINNKLTGRDFDPNKTLNVSSQVLRLIELATSNENLSQCYIGWCPFW
ncbi:serine/threonine-protein kinase mtor [Anaeramoeba flamelloides]|uniref:Serine/threonine-protein kinase TOR n=1 Tax=Anaeramoeba flamelloides TaxID=1746091 RepID=A0AAV7Y5D4_9EUKA|nr:serine/threonine-protein kinase mtor [Anaeramoeba flamelloides]